MYDELVKRLREHNGWALNETLDQAADAIEELQKLNCELLFRVGQAKALIDYYQTGRMISNEPPKEEK